MSVLIGVGYRVGVATLGMSRTTNQVLSCDTSSRSILHTILVCLSLSTHVTEITGVILEVVLTIYTFLIDSRGWVVPGTLVSAMVSISVHGHDIIILSEVLEKVLEYLRLNELSFAVISLSDLIVFLGAIVGRGGVNIANDEKSTDLSPVCRPCHCQHSRFFPMTRGSDRPVVLVLCVTSEAGLLFVANRNRICVGITRQVGALVVIGDTDTPPNTGSKENNQAQEGDNGEAELIKSKVF